MDDRLARVLRLAAASLLLGSWGSAQAQNGNAGAPSKPGATPSPSPAETVALSQIAEQSQTITSEVNAMTADSPADQSAAAIRQALPDLSAQVSLWLTESARTLNQRPSLDTLHNLQTDGRKLDDGLDSHSTVLNERAKTLDDQTGQLQEAQKLWLDTDAFAKTTAPPETQAMSAGAVAAIEGAMPRIKDRRKSVLELQSQLSSLRSKLRAGLDTVRRANSAALKTLFVRDSAPLWRPQTTINSEATARAAESPAAAAGVAYTFAREHLDLLGLHAAIILGLLILLLWLRRGLHKWTEEEPHLKRAAPIFEVPLATAITLSLLAKDAIYPPAPQIFNATLWALWLLPTVVLLRRLLDARLHPALYFLILFYLVGQVRLVLAPFPVLERWIFSGEMLAAALVFYWLTNTSGSRTENDVGAVLGPWPRRFCRLAILVLVGALAAEVLGYVRLGTTLGTGVLRSSYLAVVLFALLQVLAGLLLIALRVRPLSSSHIARAHHTRVHQQIYRVLDLFAFCGWLWLTLGFFQVQAPVADWTLQALHCTLGVGTLTVGKLIGFGLAIWLSVLIARLTRFFLEEEVFERITLAPGLPYAISAILNYTVLFVGFLLALGTLGVGLNQITILAGAFSVGLGFGLQNIINNFVSGVILLFERPVKVGDIIQIGDAIGKVRRIGIRASIIRTRDGSSIIVPNGNLISNQFTNWTYSDRHRAIEIPLSIASGADPNRVLSLLKTAAAAHGATQDMPAPEAYITALTAGSISLVVRAWISNYEDWVETRSALSLALVDALASENIHLA